MNLYRISREKYIKDLSGEGAKKYGGRWNLKGTAVIYTSECESLAVLETLVHTPVSAIPDDLTLMILSVPDHLKPETIETDNLPEDWRSYPASNKLAEIGSDWIESKSNLLMKVPSVLTESDWNVLINPSHSDMNKIKVNEIRPFRYDMRLFKSY